MAFKKLVIASGQVSGASHSDFPILIQPSKMTGWEALTLAEAQSIRIYTDEAKTNEVAREVVSADEIHCKVPTLTSSTELYVDIDGIRSDLSPGATYGRNAVWNTKSRLSVWHDAGSTDSTGNGHDGTANGGVTLGGATGKLGAATLYDGVNDYSNVGTLGSFGSSVGNANGWSVSLWVKGDFEANVSLIGNVPDFGSNMLWQLITQNLDIGYGVKNYVNIGTRANNGSGDYLTTHFLEVDSTDLFDGNWHKLTLVAYPPGTSTTRTADDIDWFVDGVQQTTYIDITDTRTRKWGEPGEYSNFTRDTPIAARQVRGSIDFHANLTMEEMQIALSNDFSDSYITTEYNNQNDVASFWGTVTDAGGDPPAVADTGFFAFM